MNKLLTVYDDHEPLNNVLSALTLDVDEVFYVYHHEVSRNTFSNIEKVIGRHKDIALHFLQLSDDEKELKTLLSEYEDLIIDVGGSKYLSLLLFELSSKQGNTIIYYDNKENTIKDYRTHTVLHGDVFRLQIEDVLKLRGGEIVENMHQAVSDSKTRDAVVTLLENNIDNYASFIRYLSKVNSLISNGSRKNGTIFDLDEETRKKIITDSSYPMADELFTIRDGQLIFRTRKLKEIACVSGTLLENYLQIRLSESGQFDDVMMSAVIDFSDEKYRHPVRCEIDCLVIRNNKMLFVSCKSSKADTEDLNEIYVHNSMFGNALSVPVLCVGEEVDDKYPSTYAKAEELGIYVIDRSSFVHNDVVQVFLDILNGTYVYDTF